MRFYVPRYVHVIYYLWTGSGKSQQERDQARDETNPAQELPSQDPICPIKKQLQADASSVIFLWGGTEAKKTSMCFHALEKVQKAPEKDLDEVNPGNPRIY